MALRFSLETLKHRGLENLFVASKWQHAFSKALRNSFSKQIDWFFVAVDHRVTFADFDVARTALGVLENGREEGKGCCGGENNADCHKSGRKNNVPIVLAHFLSNEENTKSTFSQNSEKHETNCKRIPYWENVCPPGDWGAECPPRKCINGNSFLKVWFQRRHDKTRHEIEV